MRTLAEWLRYQEQRHPLTIELGLERVRTVADRLQLLPLRVPGVIVGGTNGKGSTCTTLAALLQASGLRTGLFTSPHLVHYNERIQLDGRPLDDASLCAAFERIEMACGDVSLSFFEYNALAALDCFAHANVDAVVLEVGLGGRLDATNIVDADVAVVCSIGMDHMDWLGPTLEHIGAEKAGIFRPRQRVVLGTADQPRSVYDAMLRLDCDARIAGRDFDWQLQGQGQGRGQGKGQGEGTWRCQLQDAGASVVLDDLPPPQLWGQIQYRNAATALAAWLALHQARPLQVCRPSREVAAAGLQAVTLPGRLQLVDRGAEWLLDVAHNVAAAEVLAQALRQRPPAHTLAIFGMLGDKDVAGVTRVLDELVDEWWLCAIAEPRGLSANDLAARMTTRGGRREFASVATACTQALREARPGDRVLVCGSFHVVGPALQCLGL